MAKPSGQEQQRSPKYERVAVANLRRGRRGKHYDLVDGIFRDSETLPPGSAIKIPLARVDGITLANLRSAIHRGAEARSMAIETMSDRDNFYIWKAGK